MKKLLRWTVMVVASLSLSVFSINTSKAQGRVSFQVFYDELDPYGTWMEHRTYGYVWMPSAERDFIPYASNGYWVQTEYGNTWVSDYNWGWAPFHYGRWFYDDFYGWLWTPGSEWAPAWVTWRSGGGYYGWAPLMPGLNINVSASYYDHIPNHYWSFVPHRYILYRDVHRHYVARPRVVNVIHHTTVITDNYNYDRRSKFFTGPTRRDIEQRNRERVTVYNVSSGTRPGRTEIARERVTVYRPDVDDSRRSQTRSMPSRVVHDNDRTRTEYKSTRQMPAPQRTSEINRQRERADNLDRQKIKDAARRAETEREVQSEARQRAAQQQQRTVERQRPAPVERAPEQRREREQVKRETPQQRPEQQPREQPQVQRERSTRPSPSVEQPRQRNEQKADQSKQKRPDKKKN